MRIITSQILQNYEGEDLMFEGKPLTVKSALIGAINNNLPTEIFTAETKNKIYGLSNKLYANTEIDLTVDDIAFIKERAGIIWNSLVYGRICELFEGQVAS